MSNFQPLEIVDRGSETQPQVVENLHKFSYRSRKRVKAHEGIQQKNTRRRRHDPIASN